MKINLKLLPGNPGEGIKKLFLIMKLTLFLTFILTFNVSASVWSQSTKMDVKVKNSTLQELFTQIESKSNYRFFYNNEDVDVSQKVSVAMENKTIGDILTEAFTGLPYQFTEVSNNLILIEKKADSNANRKFQPQQKSVSGKVTDSKGQPLPGVTLVVKGTTNGTVTNTDGEYFLSNVPEDAILQFSFVGMKTQEISVVEKTNIDVVMEEDAIGIEEVVAIGYATQKKVNLTGSVVDVKSEKITNIPVANVTNTLAGQLPGVVAIQRSGEPGLDDADISIRGFGSALIIVDGVERDFSQIDPNEIESISILKDAAAAIYGARAGNGVILVTTKRGKTGKPVINFNANLGFQSNTRLPEFVNAGEYAQSLNDALINAGYSSQFTDYQIKAYKYVSGDKNIEFSDDEKNQFESEKANFANTDWLDVVFKPSAPIQQYNLSSTGGNDKIKYFLSLGYLDQQSILRSGDDNFKKYNIRANIDAQITKDLSVGFDLTGQSLQSLYPGYTIEAIWNMILNDAPTVTLNPDTEYPTGMAQASADGDISGTRKSNTKIFGGSFSLNYTVPFIKGLTAKASFDYYTTHEFDKDFLKAYSIYSYDAVNDITNVRLSNYVPTTNLTEYYAESQILTARYIISYENKFGKHNVSALAIGEYIDQNNKWFNAYRIGYLTTSIEQLFAGSTTGMQNDGNESEDGRISYASRINYTYSGKYLLETTFRYDASPRFSSGQRWGFFPSVLVGWRLSEENFMKNNLSAVNNLKLRLSYGQAGVDNISSYNYLSGYEYDGGFVDNGEMVSGIYTTGLANVNTTWEKHTTYNAGFDFGLWGSKLYGSIDAFYKKRSGILATRANSLPNTFGASLPYENLNSMNYRGFELQLGYRGKYRELQYNIGGNIAWNRVKNGHIEESDYSNSDVYTKLRYQESGQWTNRYFGLEAVGLFQSQDDIDTWSVIQDNNNNSTIRPGDIKYLDYDGDNVITDLDYHPIGKGNTPEITYGLNIGAKLKGFDMNMLWQGATNYGIVTTGGRTYPYNPTTLFRYQLDYWSTENTDAKYPRIVWGGGASNNKYDSSYWLIDAYYIRLKNIQLGYSLPSRFYKSIGISSCRFYLSAVNLLTITNVLHFDPETPSISASSSYGSFPQQKTISIGVNLSL